jgi:hypothetical protein
VFSQLSLRIESELDCIEEGGPRLYELKLCRSWGVSLNLSIVRSLNSLVWPVAAAGFIVKAGKNALDAGTDLVPVRLS